jgi:2'-5' RNA ligase
MRTFLAYDVQDEGLKRAIREFQQNLNSTGCGVKPVNPEIIHFTMRFFGELDQDQVDSIIRTLSGSEVEGFELTVPFKGIGVFPNEKRISVIWLGTDEAVSEKFREHARQAGLPPRNDSERFSPHLTIARVRSVGGNKNKLLDLIHSNEAKEFGTVKIRNLKLKMSELFPSGPKYTDLHVFN